MMKISESLIIGFDCSQNETEVALSVAKHNGSTLTCVNVFHGEEALDLYGKLTTQKEIKKENER